MKYIYITVYDKTEHDIAVRFGHQFVDANSVNEAYDIGQQNLIIAKDKLFLNDYVVCIDELK